MPRGGDFIIETADVTVAPGDTTRGPDLIAGDYVTVSITDTGCGIADDLKTQLFEPYFTTKKPGEGKGLGLAMSYGILKQSGGHITFKSQIGRGTTFTVYLPRFLASSAEETASPAGESILAEPIPGSGVILLVEADAALRGAAGAVLEKNGYTVHRAAGSREAISIAGRLPTVDLLLTDAMMPEMTGQQLAKWLGSLHPDIKVLFTSSLDKDKAAEEGILYPNADFLRKPYAPAILAAKAHAVLSAEPAKTEVQIAAGV
jgi:CheY-like chemotaxis protein